MSEALELEDLQILVKEAKKYYVTESDKADRLTDEQIRENCRIKGLEDSADALIELIHEMWDIGYLSFHEKYSPSDTDKRILSIKVTDNARLDVQLSNGDNGVYEIFYEENEERMFLNSEYPLFEILSRNPLDINEGVLFISDYSSETLVWTEIDVIALFKGKESIQGFYYNADDTEPDIDNSLAEYGIENADKLPKKTIEIEVQISDDEKLEIARKQNELLEKIVKTELAAKRVAKEYKTTIDALELELNELHNDWQRPFDIEYHSVRFFIDKENKKVHYFHLTKPELIKSEPLQPPTIGEKSLFGGVEADDIEFPDFDTSEESTNEFLNEINSDTVSEPNTSDEEE